MESECVKKDPSEHKNEFEDSLPRQTSNLTAF